MNHLRVRSRYVWRALAGETDMSFKVLRACATRSDGEPSSQAHNRDGRGEAAARAASMLKQMSPLRPHPGIAPGPMYDCWSLIVVERLTCVAEGKQWHARRISDGQTA
jgi:hypothetical protein